MDKTLTRKLVQSIFQFKRLIEAGFVVDVQRGKGDLNMSELVLLKAFEDNSLELDSNVGLSDVRPFLAISKAAVSQMLGAMEKKGYINRDIDKSNRRNLIVTLTDKGHEALEVMYEDFACRIERIITHLGEDDITHMISTIDRMSKAIEELHQGKQP